MIIIKSQYQFDQFDFNKRKKKKKKLFEIENILEIITSNLQLTINDNQLYIKFIYICVTVQNFITYINLKKTIKFIHIRIELINFFSLF